MAEESPREDAGGEEHDPWAIAARMNARDGYWAEDENEQPYLFLPYGGMTGRSDTWATKLDEWCREVDRVKRVAEDQEGPYWVSTVFLGIDHGFSLNPASPPILYETMVFGARKSEEEQRAEWELWREATFALPGMEGVPFPPFRLSGLGNEVFCDRYATRAEARAGHVKAIEMVKLWLSAEEIAEAATVDPNL